MFQANVIVGFSNLIGIYLSKDVKELRSKLIIYLAVFASLFYHMSETTYGEKGFNMTTMNTAQLLLFDRIFAILGVFTMGLKIYANPKRLTENFIKTLFFGAIFLVLSEYDIIYEMFTKVKLGNVNKVQYVICHCLWHHCAFYCLATTLK
jgi:hypothetical protein